MPPIGRGKGVWLRGGRSGEVSLAWRSEPGGGVQMRRKFNVIAQIAARTSIAARLCTVVCNRRAGRQRSFGFSANHLVHRNCWWLAASQPLSGSTVYLCRYKAPVKKTAGPNLLCRQERREDGPDAASRYEASDRIVLM